LLLCSALDIPLLPRRPSSSFFLYGYSPHPSFFLFTDPAPPEIYTLSLHDALPISPPPRWGPAERRTRPSRPRAPPGSVPPWRVRSEEHTSELQSRFDLVCRLLLEKKKIKIRHVLFLRSS